MKCWPRWAPNWLRRPFCRVVGHVRKPIYVPALTWYTVKCGRCTQTLVRVVPKYHVLTDEWPVVREPRK